MKVWSQHAFRFAKKKILTAVIIYTVTENREGGWVNQNSSFKSSKMTAITALQLRKKHV